MMMRSSDLKISKKSSKENLGEDETAFGEQTSLSVVSDPQEIDIDINYYEIVRKVLMPFVLTGAPISHYLKREDATKFKCLSKFGVMLIYSIIITILIHLLCGFWLVRVAYRIFGLNMITRTVWDDVFTLLYSFVGVVALDIMWIRHKSLKKLIAGLDKRPDITRRVLTHKYFILKFRLKLAFLSLFVISLMVLCLSYVGVVVMVAFTADVSDAGGLWTDKMMSLLPLYSLYLVLFVLSLYIVLCWITKFKFEHLNKYIDTLKTENVKPSVDQLEIIKNWYKLNLDTATQIDSIFNFFMFGFFAILFVGIVIQIEEVIYVFGSEQKSLTDVLLSFLFIGLMIFSLFYTISQTSEVNEHSTATKDILYEYILSTKPEDRSEEFYNEFQLIISGLLTKSASLTLLGLVNLNKNFMATAVVFIYTYSILFKQFASDSNIQLKNISDILLAKS